jgi:hypothetical protein
MKIKFIPCIPWTHLKPSQNVNITQKQKHHNLLKDVATVYLFAKGKPQAGVTECVLTAHIKQICKTKLISATNLNTVGTK